MQNVLDTIGYYRVIDYDNPRNHFELFVFMYFRSYRHVPNKRELLKRRCSSLCWPWICFECKYGLNECSAAAHYTSTSLSTMTRLQGYEQNLFIMFYVLLFSHKFFNNKKSFFMLRSPTCRLFEYENLHNITNLSEMKSFYIPEKGHDCFTSYQTGGCHGIDC